MTEREIIKGIESLYMSIKFDIYLKRITCVTIILFCIIAMFFIFEIYKYTKRIFQKMYNFNDEKENTDNIESNNAETETQTVNGYDTIKSNVYIGILGIYIIIIFAIFAFLLQKYYG